MYLLGSLDISLNIRFFLTVDFGISILSYIWVKRIYSMSPNETFFFAELYSLVKKMEETIEEFDMKDRTVASIVIGVIDYDAVESGDTEAEMKTMYSFNIQDRQELETVKTIMDNAYKDEDDPLDNLLGDLGISLN